jgi:hypothetical protein
VLTIAVQHNDSGHSHTLGGMWMFANSHGLWAAGKREDGALPARYCERVERRVDLSKS